MVRDYNFKGVDFENYPVYNGQLGVFYSQGSTQFTIWAPTAKRVLLRIYQTGLVHSVVEVFHMKKIYGGVFEAVLEGDWKNKFYTFQVEDENGWLNETLGPDVKATGINGCRGVIIDMRDTDPEGWQQDRYVSLNSPVDAVLYEMHVRDFTIHKSTSHLQKGKYLGVVERNTISHEGRVTGLDHLLELGITHVHLLPISDFYTVDEQHPSKKYNWGYDPLHFNSPEGWYANNPWDCVSRIREVKQMVKELHSNGLGVVLDVVYNHTGLVNTSTMNQTVPGYFYRQNEDGDFSNASGCGNEIASERKMVQKYIVHSVCYWAKEYHIDGFRFDLMGILDIETMNLIERSLRKINPNVLLYGEGWSADTSPLHEMKRAVKSNTKLLNNIASFSDDFRDAVKGSTFMADGKGFITGLKKEEENLRFGTVGAINHPQLQFGYITSSPGPWANHPTQAVNYVSCHDNFTLFDKVMACCPNEALPDVKRRIKLALGLTLTAQGIPFLHSGIEFLRTKQGHHNTYKSSDRLNAIDWALKDLHFDVFTFCKELIALRKKHSVFRMQTAEEVCRNLRFSEQYRPGTLFYALRSTDARERFTTYLVCVNANEHEVHWEIPYSNWEVILSSQLINYSKMKEIHTFGGLTLPPLTMMVLACKRNLIELFD